MKALVYTRPENMVVRQVEDLLVRPGEVLIKVKAAGICGSDVHGYLGTTGRRTAPMIMGHEFSGIVAETGDGVKGIKKDDRVTVQPLIFCGKCGYCKEGLTNLCINKKMFGVMDLNGSMAEYISVPEFLVYKLPDSVSYVHAAMMEPLAVAYSAARSAPEIRGKSVLIIGAGTIGLLLLQVILRMAPLKVIISDVSDFRLELARKLGANHTINPSNKDFRAAVDAITGSEGVDVSFEAVGISQTVQQAMSALKIKGTCVWIGNSAKMVELNMQEVVTRELSVIGTYAYTHNDFGDSVKLMSEMKFDLDSMISSVVPLDEGPEMFRRLAREPGELIKVILTH